MAVLAPESVFAGSFRVIGKIGAGGMGAVYEVEQLSTRKRRALKVLSNRLGGDDKSRTRFVREATVGADIDSEHCVDVIGAGFDAESGLPWLAMELLDGIDLKRLVDLQGSLGHAHALKIFRQVGHGLAAAHDAKVIHRDLKPENVFIARSKRAGSNFIVKLLDFGIAKITRDAVGSTDTATVGSPMWMAPEQINAAPLSPRTDVWALGLLAFWALTGRIYWTAAYGERVTVQALFAEQLFAELVPARARADHYHCGIDLPPAFDDWFANCVNRSPQERFADARAATRALIGILEPGAAADVRADAPLLPPPGEPVASAAPPPSADAAPRVESYAMAGTTADVLAKRSEALISETAPSEARIGVESTNVQAPLNSTQHPTQFGEPSGPIVVRSAPRSPAVVAAAIAIPVVLLGSAIAGGAMLWSDDAEPSDDDAEVATGPSVSALPDAKTPPKPRDPVDEPVRTGLIDLSSLPSPQNIEMVGWSQEGSNFAARVAYQEGPGGSNRLTLIHVYDARGGLVESYVEAREAPEGIDPTDPLELAGNAAFGEDAWRERSEALRLRQPAPRRAPSSRSGELRLEVDDAPGLTRLQIQPKRTGFFVRWWGFDELTDPSASEPASLVIDWTESGGRTKLMEVPIEMDFSDLARLAGHDEDAAVEGNVQMHWSADTSHCVIVIDLSMQVGEEVVADHRLFARKVPAAGG